MSVFTTLPATGGSSVDTGRTLISEVIADNDATVDISNVFDSTYDRYDIELINIRPATDDVILLSRVESGGSFQSGAEYDWNLLMRRSGLGTSNQSNAENGTSGVVAGSVTANFGLGNHALGGLDGVVTVFDPASTTRYALWNAHTNFVQDLASAGTDRNTQAQANWLWEGGAGAITGVQFLVSSGNITSGTFRVWGYPTS